MIHATRAGGVKGCKRHQDAREARRRQKPRKRECALPAPLLALIFALSSLVLPPGLKVPAPATTSTCLPPPNVTLRLLVVIVQVGLRAREGASCKHSASRHACMHPVSAAELSISSQLLREVASAVEQRCVLQSLQGLLRLSLPSSL